jgi:hypothetical protein
VLPDDDHKSKHVGAFNVCFRIIQYILVHLLVLIIDGTMADYVESLHKHTSTSRVKGKKIFLTGNINVLNLLD